jgi:hypothetical protein
MSKGRLFIIGAALLATTVAVLPRLARSGNPFDIEVIVEDGHEFKKPLRDVEPANKQTNPPRVVPLLPTHPGAGFIEQADTVVQKSPLAAAPTTAGLGFDGVGRGFTGPQGTFTVDAAPPDTNGAVGTTQYVQWVNESFAVFDKATGAVLKGPIPGNTLWSNTGNGCATNNDGDPIVQFDKINQRWIFTQFSVSTTPYRQCIAVSTSDDALGSYYVYSFQTTQFPDYPKLGVWSDGYYITFNMFNGNSFAGPKVCALDGAAMRAGNPATIVCFQLGTSVASLLPADIDGTTLPPAGAPNFLLSLSGSSALNFYKFHADFVTPANSTFTGPVSIPVAGFTRACNGGACVPQKSSKQKLDSLGDRLMYRLAYRNFGTYETLLVNHSVAAGSSSSGQAGVRWYELRSASGQSMASATPVVNQQGTYAPSDNLYRWMGSMAMDKAGNIAVGYSISGTGLNPGIRYAGRQPTDAAGKLGSEVTIVNGSGAQTQPLNRWGDYSAMTIDPIDDCTFWYTNEYLKTNGNWNWSTRIASFKFNSCN